MQVRCAPMGGVYGLDFNAVFAFAAAAGVRGQAALVLTDVLTPVERLVVHSYRKDDET